MNFLSGNFHFLCPPVPEMRTGPIPLAFLLLTLGGVALAADEARSSTDAFMKCARIANDVQRLSCYDRLATELIELGHSSLDVASAGSGSPATVAEQSEAAPASAAAGDSAPEAPSVSTGGGAAAVAATEQGFGLERVEEAQDKDVKMIQSRYVGDFTGWDGKTTFPLENGQVWQQIESGRMAWNASNPMITIKRGFMGSYMLSVEGVNKTVRVKRIK